MITAEIYVPGIVRHRKLGREDYALTLVFDEVAEGPLRRIIGVVDLGVDEILAVIDISVEDMASPVPSDRGHTCRPERPSRRIGRGKWSLTGKGCLRLR